MNSLHQEVNIFPLLYLNRFFPELKNAEGTVSFKFKFITINLKE